MLSTFANVSDHTGKWGNKTLNQKPKDPHKSTLGATDKQQEYVIRQPLFPSLCSTEW